MNNISFILIYTFMKYIKLFEALTSVIYHFTDTDRVINLLEENKINLTPVFGTKADLEINKKKLYFLSLTSSRSTDVGYAASKGKNGLVRITFDGFELNKNFKSIRVDFWQRPKDPQDPLYNPDGKQKGREFYRTISRQDELEDRIICDKDEILNAKKYIKFIEILNGNDEKVSHMKHLCDKLDIPFYAYDNENYFNSSIKNKALVINGEKKDLEKYSTSIYGLERLISYLLYKDAPLKNKVYGKIKDNGLLVDLNKLDKDLEEQHREIKYSLNTSNFTLSELSTVLSYIIHNNKTSTDKYTRFIIREFGLDMKRNRCDTMREYLLYKFWKGMKTQKDYNKEFNTNILNVIDKSYKENLESMADRNYYDEEGNYMDNIYTYLPIKNYLDSYIDKIKKYCSNYILNNNDMYKYSFELDREHIGKAIELDKADFEQFDKIEYRYLDSLKDTIKYVLHDIDDYYYNEVKRMRDEYDNQFYGN